MKNPWLLFLAVLVLTVLVIIFLGTVRLYRNNARDFREKKALSEENDHPENAPDDGKDGRSKAG